ncbi:hypothetical protein DRP05_06640 [Archaeoglobales archaeon]|mgnify:CR=1 FL=1|nr:MAG: hypothetical protein DRP05_06640 [Archaeoglobales archaeon]
MEIEYTVVGAGYSGLMCYKSLIDKGFDAIIFEMREVGGELSIFSKLPEFRQHYEQFISEMAELKEEVVVEFGTVVKTKPVIVTANESVKRLDSKNILLCTGAADKNPVKSMIIKNKMKGVYTLDNALKSLASGLKIGEKILMIGDDEIVKIAENQFNELEYDVEVISHDDFQIKGKNRVESVEVGGDEYRCDTLIICVGRETFNPLKLKGMPVGNAKVCTYDYRDVKEDVKRFISSLK